MGLNLGQKRFLLSMEGKLQVSTGPENLQTRLQTFDDGVKHWSIPPKKAGEFLRDYIYSHFTWEADGDNPDPNIDYNELASLVYEYALDKYVFRIK